MALLNPKQSKVILIILPLALLGLYGILTRTIHDVSALLIPSIVMGLLLKVTFYVYLAATVANLVILLFGRSNKDAKDYIIIMLCSCTVIALFLKDFLLLW